MTAADAGTYTITLTGTCGNPVTHSATLTVNENVVVASAPVSLTNCPGTTASFSVSATGTGLNYQWLKDGLALPGATSSTLTLNNVASVHAGTYAVVVRGTCGNAVTNSATLTVNENVVVASAPISLTNCPGTTASFNVTATGTGLSYQWSKNGIDLVGQTSSSLTFNNVTASGAGTYTITVSGTCGNPVTHSATLTVNETVVVASAPISLTNCPGTTANFNISATGTGLSYQWSKNGTDLVGQTSSSVTVNSVTASDAGTYAVVVTGACGNSTTHSATLTVSEALMISVSPANSTNCPGTTAAFQALASGTGLSFQWYRSGMPLSGQSAAVLILTNVASVDTGVYSVVAAGICGVPVTNQAVLIVQSSIAATPLANEFRNPGERAQFSTVASGTGPFTYAWKKDGVLIAGATTPTLAIPSVTASDIGTYAVEVRGACGQLTRQASLTLNQPPTVTIVSPTNGTVFIAPASFPVIADPQDVDGVVTNVEFFASGTNKLGETSGLIPCLINLANLNPGTYTFTARATDDLGAQGISAPVTITVIERPPLTIVSAMKLNPYTGLFEQTVRVSNPTYSTFSTVRVNIAGLPSSIAVYVASGTNNGVPYVESNTPVPPGGYVDFLIEYYSRFRITPNPTLTAELVAPKSGSTGDLLGTQQPIHRGVMLANGTFLVEFLSQPNRTYFVQYTEDLLHWKTAQSSVRGNGSWIQWIDNGQPKTESLPSGTDKRFYRLIMAP